MTAPAPARAAGLPTTRYVEHVMGMPVSVALRGRHAADHVGADAWAAVMDELRGLAPSLSPLDVIRAKRDARLLVTAAGGDWQSVN